MPKHFIFDKLSDKKNRLKIALQVSKLGFSPSSWKKWKIKNDTTFVRMRSGDHLGDAKMSKKGTSLRRI